MSSPPKQLHVLVVEDEGMVAMMIEDMLADMGHEVTFVASRIGDALEFAQNGIFDFAILDVNLAGQPSYPIADILRERGLPFVFATGYGKEGLGSKYADTPFLTKPFRQADLESILSDY